MPWTPTTFSSTEDGRYTWDEGRWHPYVGGGLELDRADVKISGGGGSFSDDDLSFGLYVHGGVQFDLGEGDWFLALDARYGGLGAEHDIGPLEVDSDYTRFSLLVGKRF